MFNTNYSSRSRLNPLDNDVLRRLAPSIFADAPHASRSERYTYIPTINVVEALRAEGFSPVEARQGRSRIPGKADFTKHLIKFVAAGSVNTLQGVGDSIPQVCLVNSHDGTSGYKLYAGMFRLVCSNGMLVCDDEFDSISVHHKGNIRDNVIEGSFRVIDESKKALERVTEWRTLQLSAPEQIALANAAIGLRFDDANKQPVVNAEQILMPRRNEDKSNDLWTTFNRVQESLVKGGNRYRTSEGRRMRTRPVQGIDADTSLNRALWRLADEMAALKAAA